MLSKKVFALTPTLFGVIDEQDEIIEEESALVVKNVKMFLTTAIYGDVELDITNPKSRDAASEKISKKSKVLNCYDIINTWYHMLGAEAFEISKKERDDLFNLRLFIEDISALFITPRGREQIFSILCEPDDISAATDSFIYFTEHGNEVHFKTT